MKFPVTFDNGLVLVSLKDPVWATDKKDAINVTAEFEGIGEVPFTARKEHAEKHTVDIFKAAKAMKPAAYSRPDVTVHDLQVELDKLMPDVILGLATEDELALAKNLRLQIKAMSE